MKSGRIWRYDAESGQWAAPIEDFKLTTNINEAGKGDAAAPKTKKPRAPAAKKPETAAPTVAPQEDSASDNHIETLTALILSCLDEAKAEETIQIDLRGRTSLADTMIVTSGRSNTHVGSVAERILRGCKEAGFGTPRVEGMPHNDWVLVDAFDVIVHIFRPDVRRFYNLEKMWGIDRPEEARIG